MPGPKFLYLIFAAAAVALLAWFMHRAERNSWQEKAIPHGAKILGQFPVNDVVSVDLSGPDGRVRLQRGEHGWGVVERGGYPADFEKISGLILRLSDLKAVQSVPVAPADYGAMALRTGADEIPREEAGTQVELKNAGGQSLAAVILGKADTTTPTGMRPEIDGTASGRYVVPVGQGGDAYLVAETFPDLLTTPAAWIDHSFLRPGPLRRVEVAGQEGNWILTREASGAPWEMDGLRKNQSLDTTKAMTIDSLFASMAVADVPDGPDDARVKPLAENPVTVTADTFDGVRYSMTIGRGDGDNLPVRVTAEASPEGPEAQTEETKNARGDALAAAKKFEERTVFIPRNFLAPFLGKRASLIGKMFA